MQGSDKQFPVSDLREIIRSSVRIIRKLRCFLRCFREQLDSRFKRLLRREIGVGDAIVPAETVFIDQRPGESHS